MPKAGKKKGPFEDLDKDFRASIDGASDAEINAKIAEIAKNDAALAEAMAADQDLAEKKDQVKAASQVYRDGKKFNRLRINYARQVLVARGKPAGDSGVE